MLDINAVFSPEKSVEPFRGHAEDWTLARDHYLSGVKPYCSLVGATRLLMLRVCPRLKTLEFAYTEDRDAVLTDVMATTDSGERYPLPSFDDRLPHYGPPWFEHSPFNECPELADVMSRDTYGAAFDDAGRVVADWLGAKMTTYADFEFLMLTLAFIARDSEGALTELTIR